MYTITGIQTQIADIVEIIEGDITPDVAQLLHRKVVHIAESIEDNIARARPMLLMTFDDVEAEAGFICNPPLTLRCGGELERCQIVDASNLDFGPLRRTIGDDTVNHCAEMIHLSRILEDNGLGSLIEAREMSEADFAQMMVREKEPCPSF